VVETQPAERVVAEPHQSDVAQAVSSTEAQLDEVKPAEGEPAESPSAEAAPAAPGDEVSGHENRADKDPGDEDPGVEQRPGKGHTDDVMSVPADGLG